MTQLENVIVAGKSGAGKQPRIDVLTETFGLTQLSTGNIFRFYLGLLDGLSECPAPADFWDAASEWFVSDDRIRAALEPLCAGSDIALDDAVLALKVKHFVLSGLFVPDRITNALFEAAFAKHDFRGCALDGYPRTVDQAKFLLSLLQQHQSHIDAILLVEAEDEAIIERLAGRRICPDGDCGKVYHLAHKPPKDGKYCTACGKEVILRADDTEEKIRKRLDEFANKAKPAVDYLQAQNIAVASVPGNLPQFSKQAVTESVLGALKGIGIA